MADDQGKSGGAGAEAPWLATIVAKLNELIPNAGNCLACGPMGLGKVTVGHQLVTPVLTDPGGGITIGGSTMPQVPLICTNCGYTRYFNYMVLKQHITGGSGDG